VLLGGKPTSVDTLYIIGKAFGLGGGRTAKEEGERNLFSKITYHFQPVIVLGISNPLEKAKEYVILHAALVLDI